MKKLNGETLLNFRIVLVRPRNPLNIGAAARAMANFGFSDLVVVKPHGPVWRETVSAVGAEKLVLAARKADSLDDAVADCHWILGTTTARHRRLARALRRLPAVLPSLANRPGQKIAVLFGSEKTGLSNKYLERCHEFLTIPTSPQCPSMNLGQAVAVVCYELARGKFSTAKAQPLPPATARQVEQLTQNWLTLFNEVDYLKFLPAVERARKIRRVLSQWKLRSTDVSLLHGIARYVMRSLQENHPHPVPPPSRGRGREGG